MTICVAAATDATSCTYTHPRATAGALGSYYESRTTQLLLGESRAGASASDGGVNVVQLRGRFAVIGSWYHGPGAATGVLDTAQELRDWRDILALNTDFADARSPARDLVTSTSVRGAWLKGLAQLIAASG